MKEAKKLKVLVTIPSGFCYGLQHVSLDLFAASRAAVEPHFLVSKWSNGDFEKLVKNNGFNYSYSWLGMFSRKMDWYNLKMSIEALIRVPFLYFTFLQLIRKKKPDLLFFANHHELILLLPVLWITKIKVVCHMHDPSPAIGFQKKTFAWYGKRVNHFVAISDDVKKRLMLLGCEASKITVVHNGIRLPEGSVSKEYDFIEQFNWPTSSFLIGITGQMTATKGHEDVLEAFAIAKQKNAALKLVIGGKPIEPFYTLLQERIFQLHLENDVRFTGWLVDVGIFYKNIDIFIMASRHDEGYGLVVAEAMANLRPVIITKSGGAVEILENGKTGFIVEKRDTIGMAKVMLRYASDQQFYKSIQQAARVRIEEFFTITIAANSFSFALKQITSNFNK